VTSRPALVYLDHNATSPLRDVARDAMLPWFGRPANPFSTHAAGRAAAAAVDEARAQVAALAGWRREGVFFTSGATEANATALSHGRWLVSAVEHPSVLVWAAETLPVDAEGRVRLDVLAELLGGGAPPSDAPAGAAPRGGARSRGDPRRLPAPVGASPGRAAGPGLDRPGFDGVSVMLANNETGVVQPIAAIAAAVHRAGLLLHVDASQAPGRIPLALAADADLLTLSSHKLGGPQGVGALLVRAGRSVEPLLRGGPQERGRRAGTHNVAGIVGFGAAAETVSTAPDAALRDRLEAALAGLGGRVAGAGAERLPNTTCVGFTGVDAADLVMALDLDGVAASAGSACASGSPEPSHVLRAMRFPGSAVRFSLGPGSTSADVDAAVAAVARALPRFAGS
jgi:cysteine desulfurase